MLFFYLADLCGRRAASLAPLCKGSCRRSGLSGCFGLRWAGGASLPPYSAPKCSFGTFRCSGRLFFRKGHAMAFSPKRSTFRFASLALRLRTEPALRAAPVFRMAYFPYLTALRMQAKQIQRLPLRGAGAKRLKGGPWGKGQGEGARRPLPQFALGLRPHSTPAQSKTG